MVMKVQVWVFLIAILLISTGVWAGMPQASQTPGSTVTFHKDIVPVLQRNCQSCHRPGQVGPMSLLTYSETRPWAKAIKEAVVLRKMPPWFADSKYGHFNNDRSLRQNEIEAVVAWADGGAPEGNPQDAPPPVQWPSGGWQIEPDVVVELPAYPVPARGVLEWESLAIPSPFKEDTWVTSVQVLPSEPSVTHHICFTFEKHRPETFYNKYEGAEGRRDANGVELKKESGAPDESFVITREVGSTELVRKPGRPVLRPGNQFCYVPGLPFDDYRPVNAGVLVPGGADILLGTHYQTNGTAVTDRTRIGFTVSKTPPAKKFLAQEGDKEFGEASPVQRKSGINDLAIPPNEGNYKAPLTEYTFLRDIELVWFRPHAHVRGKSVEYKLIYPDGRSEIVLNVPRYDFNWQLTYRTSLNIPKGSKLQVQFYYDNSANNRANPDPAKWIYYGDQSWEEMGSPNLGFLVANERSGNE